MYEILWLYVSFLHVWHLKSYFLSGAIVDRFTYVVHPDASNDAIPPWINLKDKLRIGSNLLNKTHLPGNNDIKSIKDELRPTALAAYGKQVYLDIYLLEIIDWSVSFTPRSNDVNTFSSNVDNISLWRSIGSERCVWGDIDLS